MSSQTILTTIRMGRQVALLKGLNRADERAVLVAKRNYLQMHEHLVSSFVMKRTSGLNRPGVAQGGSERTMRAAKFAALSVAMLENVVDALVPHYLMPSVARDIFCAVVPKDDFFLAIHYAQTDLQYF